MVRYLANDSTVERFFILGLAVDIVHRTYESACSDVEAFHLADAIANCEYARIG